ncbi:MAG: enoyl-CoA hydratase [Actinobacteria bacterium]|nr:MAG: enoyl-CoA hydratase [Actinomycetota bacterium]
MGYEQLIVDVEGDVAIVRMNNATRLNALSPTMTREMLEALEKLRADEAIRAIVLTGEGRGFSAGADLSEFGEPYAKGERPQLSLFLKEGYNKLIPLLAEMPKPLIAAINGVVAGAGISLALACDLRIAGDGATFTTAWVKIGLVPDAGSSYLLPRTVGMPKAIELAMLSERVDALSALGIGLVHRVVPHESLMDEARGLAGQLARLPTVALGLTRRLLEEASHLSLSEALDREAEVQDQAAATEDHLEGVLAFLDKRGPVFKGR